MLTSQAKPNKKINFKVIKKKEKYSAKKFQPNKPF